MAGKKGKKSGKKKAGTKAKKYSKKKATRRVI